MQRVDPATDMLGELLWGPISEADARVVGAHAPTASVLLRPVLDQGKEPTPVAGVGGTSVGQIQRQEINACNACHTSSQACVRHPPVTRAGS